MARVCRLETALNGHCTKRFWLVPASWHCKQNVMYLTNFLLALICIQLAMRKVRLGSENSRQLFRHCMTSHGHHFLHEATSMVCYELRFEQRLGVYD
eukprot:1159696-Pelagomonas_calceolata.AAC.14